MEAIAPAEAPAIAPAGPPTNSPNPPRATGNPTSTSPLTAIFPSLLVKALPTAFPASLTPLEIECPKCFILNPSPCLTLKPLPLFIADINFLACFSPISKICFPPSTNIFGEIVIAPPFFKALCCAEDNFTTTPPCL